MMVLVVYGRGVCGMCFTRDLQAGVRHHTLRSGVFGEGLHEEMVAGPDFVAHLVLKVKTDAGFLHRSCKSNVSSFFCKFGSFS